MAAMERQNAKGRYVRKPLFGGFGQAYGRFGVAWLRKAHRATSRQTSGRIEEESDRPRNDRYRQCGIDVQSAKSRR